MYWKQSLQCLRAAHVDKGVILHFSKWGFTCAAPMCWNDSSVSLRSPQLLALYHCAGMHMKHAPSARHCPTKAHGHSTNDYRSALHVKSTMHLCKSYKYSWRGGGFTTYADSKHTVEHQELGDVFGHGQRAKYSFHKKCPQILNTHLHGSTWQVTSACRRKLTVLFTDIKLAISRNLSFWVPHTLINPLNCSIRCNFWNAYLMKPCRSRRIALYE